MSFENFGIVNCILFPPTTIKFSLQAILGKQRSVMSSETILSIHSAHWLKRHTQTAHATKLLQSRAGPLRTSSHVNITVWFGVGFLKTFPDSDKSSSSNSSENRMEKMKKGIIKYFHINWKRKVTFNPAKAWANSSLSHHRVNHEKSATLSLWCSPNLNLIKLYWG